MFLRLLATLLSLSAVRACTTIIAGKKATADGSVMCTHSNDGEGGTDPRLVHIPARDHAAGAMRPIFFAPENYPRYVGAARGAAAYLPSGNQTAMVPIGQIPEVPHTYSYFEETYGALNEHQLGIGESTCSGVFGAKPAGGGGKALLSVDTLTQIAMERTTSSREAVALMGSLAEKYGFYGAGSFEGTAESLMVTDPHEGFIFHILPDPTGTSAIWAAQRVPDDHIAVVPNVFIIREVNFTDAFTFLGSASVHSVAQAKGWWKPTDGLLDFTKVYSDGEYAHKVRRAAPPSPVDSLARSYRTAPPSPVDSLARSYRAGSYRPPSPRSFRPRSYRFFPATFVPVLTRTFCPATLPILPTPAHAPRPHSTPRGAATSPLTPLAPACPPLPVLLGSPRVGRVQGAGTLSQPQPRLRRVARLQALPGDGAAGQQGHGGLDGTGDAQLLRGHQV